MMLTQIKNLALLSAIIGLSIPNVCFADSVQIDSHAPIASLVASAKGARARGANNEALAFFDAAVGKDASDYMTLYQRGITYLSLGKNAQAIADFDGVLKIKPGFSGALLQRAKIKSRNAEWKGAKDDYIAGGKNKDSEEVIQLEEAEGASYLAIEADKKQDWETCVNQAGVAIMTATSSLTLRQLRARCRLELGEVEMGAADLAHVLQIHPSLVEPQLQISSLLFYSLGDTDGGVSQMKKCLHLDPESKLCKALFREEKAIVKRLGKVKSSMESKQFNSASKMLVGTNTEGDTGLLADVKENFATYQSSKMIPAKASAGLYIQLVEKTCECYVSMNSHKKAAPYCKEALELNPTSLHALLHQAQNHIDAENYEAAIQSLNTAREHHPDSAQSIQQKLNEAHIALKRSKQKDYYKVLGVSRDADDRTIKKAYRTATKIHHPDKAMARGITKEEAEKKMAAINEAYEVLSDPELKTRYDNGEDPNDPMARQGGNPFQGSPFGAGGQQFFFQQGGFPGGSGGRQFKFSGGAPGGNPFAGFPGF